MEDNELISKTRYFLRWLKDKGIYSEYKREVLKYHFSGHRFNFIPLFNHYIKNEYTRIIDVSLLWRSTAKGDLFWSKIHAEWANYCYDNHLR